MCTVLLIIFLLHNAYEFQWITLVYIIMLIQPVPNIRKITYIMNNFIHSSMQAICLCTRFMYMRTLLY